MNKQGRSYASLFKYRNERMRKLCIECEKFEFLEMPPDYNVSQDECEICIARRERARLQEIDNENQRRAFFINVKNANIEALTKERILKSLLQNN